MSEFLDMKGYGAYIWSAYALALGALWLNVWIARRQHRAALIEVRRRLTMQEETP
jgi:heme exporter protein CcmD